MFELVISLYQESNQKRHQELISCLNKNLKLNCIKKIHLLLEGDVLDKNANGNSIFQTYYDIINTNINQSNDLEKYLLTNDSKL